MKRVKGQSLEYAAHEFQPHPLEYTQVKNVSQKDRHIPALVLEKT